VDRSGNAGTSLADFVEGVDDGRHLDPQSRYESRLERRLGAPPRRPAGRLAGADHTARGGYGTWNAWVSPKLPNSPGGLW
jgi:hypothetical protein